MQPSNNHESEREQLLLLWNIIYLLTGSQDQQFALRQSLCDYVTDEHSVTCLQSYIPEYKNVSDLIDRMKFRGNTWGNEVIIFAQHRSQTKTL